MPEAAAVIASQGLWENTNVSVLEEFKKPATLEEYFRDEMIKVRGIKELLGGVFAAIGLDVSIQKWDPDSPSCVEECLLCVGYRML